MTHYNALIIGGGFYGCALALFLKKQGLEKICLIDMSGDLLTRASYTNQARVHNGYHYPRSFITALRSRINFKRFVNDYGFAVKNDFVALYAIPHKRTKVSSMQFERFMNDIGAAFEKNNSYRSLFNDQLIADVYETEEFAFDATKLKSFFQKSLQDSGVDIRLNTQFIKLAEQDYKLINTCQYKNQDITISSDYTFNCTYSQLNQVANSFNSQIALKHEIAEIALIQPPAILNKLAITVMDGPFFSTMPFPMFDCHSLSHVRYTPHGDIADMGLDNIDPDKFLAQCQPKTKVDYMLADAKRYVPALAQATYKKSLFDIKTVLLRNESDDGRPILLKVDGQHRNIFSVLGGKIDNIYDIQEKILDILSHNLNLRSV